MAMFPFVGSSYNGRSASFDAQRTLNMYLEGSESKTSRTPAMLIGTPGLLLWASLFIHSYKFNDTRNSFYLASVTGVI